MKTSRICIYSFPSRKRMLMDCYDTAHKSWQACKYSSWARKQPTGRCFLMLRHWTGTTRRRGECVATYPATQISLAPGAVNTPNGENLRRGKRWRESTPRPALTPASNRRVFNLWARSQRRMYKRWSQTGFTKVTCIPAKISLKRKIPFLKGGGETNYVRHNTFKICIEITNQAFPCDSKVQNTTLKGIQTALLYITVLVAQDGLTCQKREPNFCFYHRCQIHTVYVCMTHSCIFYTRVKIHPW